MKVMRFIGGKVEDFEYWLQWSAKPRTFTTFITLGATVLVFLLLLLATSDTHMENQMAVCLIGAGIVGAAAGWFAWNSS